MDELLFEFELLPLDPLDDGWLHELELPLLLLEPEEELPLELGEPLLDPEEPLEPDELPLPLEPHEDPLELELDEELELLPEELPLEPPPLPELEPDELPELTMPIIATAPNTTNKHSTNITTFLLLLIEPITRFPNRCASRPTHACKFSSRSSTPFLFASTNPCSRP